MPTSHSRQNQHTLLPHIPAVIWLVLTASAWLGWSGCTPSAATPSPPPFDHAEQAATQSAPNPLLTVPNPLPSITQSAINPFPSVSPSVSPSVPSSVPSSVSPSVSPSTPIGDLKPGAVNVHAVGHITEVFSFSKGFRFILQDNSGYITLLMWHNLYDSCPDAALLRVGAIVQLNGGRVSEYQGELQVQPPLGKSVQVAATAPANTIIQHIGDLPGMIGQVVTVVGSVQQSKPAGEAGVLLRLADDSGVVEVFLWNNILERHPDKQALPTVGNRLQVTGMVQLYQQLLEVVPAIPYDVIILP